MFGVCKEDNEGLRLYKVKLLRSAIVQYGTRCRFVNRSLCFYDGMRFRSQENMQVKAIGPKIREKLGTFQLNWKRRLCLVGWIRILLKSQSSELWQV